jgi:hypothetical protein
MAEANVARGGIKEEKTAAPRGKQRELSTKTQHSPSTFKKRILKKGKKGEGARSYPDRIAQQQSQRKKKHLTNSRPCLK